MAEYDICVSKNECTTQLIKYFEIIARHVSRIFYYSSKTDQESCINFAISEAYRKWNKYNTFRSMNIFSFFTTMIKNDIQTHYNYINKHKNMHISIESLFVNNQEK
jgi:hypothetical protein